MIDKLSGIQIFNYWLNDSSCHEGLNKCFVVRLSEKDRLFLMPFGFRERIEIFIKTKMSFSVAVFLRHDWSDQEMCLVDNGVEVSWDDIEDKVWFEDALMEEYVSLDCQI